MGRIGTKLKARFKSWSRQYRQGIRELSRSLPLPKDVHDVQSLVKRGHDPLHAVYIAVQNITSVFSECVSVLPEMAAYYNIVGAAEEEYMPSGPPMSPLTTSFFTTWAFFDFRFGGDKETIGTCLIDLSDQLGIDPSMVEAVRRFQESRMGIYEHFGTVGGKIGLEELVTGRRFSCICPAGYRGRPGELWYVRLCPPLLEEMDYHVAMTTPYILLGAGKSDWIAFLKRTMVQCDGPNDPIRLHNLLKYGLEPNYWNEFVFLAYHNFQRDAVFLTGIPDMKATLPHASRD
jgi:hypothetical protein